MGAAMAEAVACRDDGASALCLRRVPDHCAGKRKNGGKPSSFSE